MHCLVTIDDHPQLAVCRLGKSPDFTAIQQWKRSAASANSEIRDILEFADFAHKRWRSYIQTDRTASNLSSLKAKIKKEPTGEFVMLAVITAMYANAERIVGFCLFRRTWCNHIAIDFLATHPRGRTKEGPALRSAGLALAGFVCAIAQSLNSPAIWLETTESSARVYAKWFDLKPTEISDILIIPKSSYSSFWSKLSKGWQTTGLLPSLPAV